MILLSKLLVSLANEQNRCWKQAYRQIVVNEKNENVAYYAHGIENLTAECYNR